VRLFDRILCAPGVKGSLRDRIGVAQGVVVVLMLIPVLVSVSLMLVFSGQYHAVIAHIEKVSLLMPLIQDDLVIEMSEIVVGRERFAEGGQNDTLDQAARQLDALIDSDAASRIELVVARRTLDTLRRYVDALGAQMQVGSTVDEDENVLEEIRGVASLFVDMLHDSIGAEITAAAQASDRMQAVVRTTLMVEMGVFALTLLFTLLAQRWLSHAIREPIERLKAFAGRIASGELSERAEDPGVEELQALTVSLNTMAVKLEQQIIENRREQENLKKSELSALQAQITPHFLYNTLDAIVWLAEAKRTGEVIRITRAISDFFRTSLNNGKDWITVAQEAEHLEGYLTIQQIRYRDILQYDIRIDETLLDHQILKLVIQPLVENALYHGIKNKRSGGMLRVSIRQEKGPPNGTQGDFLLAEVWDNGAGMDARRLEHLRQALRESAPPASESGYGLYSVDKRLKLYYGQREGLRIDSVAGEGTTVRFRVPMKEYEDV
jgi:two-component system sensor histidine kinase YesM